MLRVFALVAFVSTRFPSITIVYFTFPIGSLVVCAVYAVQDTSGVGLLTQLKEVFKTTLQVT